MKKSIRILLSVMAAFGLVVTCFFGSFKAVVFNRRFINSETARYGVAALTHMQQEEVDHVFDETLKYLEHRRDDLVIDTVVAGQAREAYNQQEKLHMVDVLGLFDAGYVIYYAAIGCLLAAAAVLLAVKKEQKKELAASYARAVLIGFVIFFLLAAVIGILFYTDFDRYFVLFHEIFFDNDLWLMDPRTCLMINLMPEDFFFDIVMKFGTVFLILAVVLMAGSAIFLLLRKRKKST